jgi:outer membrane protein
MTIKTAKLAGSALACAAIALAAGLASPAMAQEAFETPSAGTIKLDVRFTGVLPDEDAPIRTAAGAATGLRAEVNDSWLPSIGVEYFVTDTISVEAIAGTFDHTVTAVGPGVNVDVLDLWHLPPTVTGKYHFTPASRVSPYVGAGLTYIWFYSQEDLNGFKVEPENGFGYALQAGVDIATVGPWSVNVDVKKIFFETDVSINNGALRSDLTLDPLVVSVGFGYKF